MVISMPLAFGLVKLMPADGLKLDAGLAFLGVSSLSNASGLAITEGHELWGSRSLKPLGLNCSGLSGLVT
jgi:hypothetical protein